jgi:hypothetical protein
MAPFSEYDSQTLHRQCFHRGSRAWEIGIDAFRALFETWLRKQDRDFSHLGPGEYRRFNLGVGPGKLSPEDKKDLVQKAAMLMASNRSYFTEQYTMGVAISIEDQKLCIKVQGWIAWIDGPFSIVTHHELQRSGPTSIDDTYYEPQIMDRDAGGWKIAYGRDIRMQMEMSNGVIKVFPPISPGESAQVVQNTKAGSSFDSLSGFSHTSIGSPYSLSRTPGPSGVSTVTDHSSSPVAPNSACTQSHIGGSAITRYPL